MKIVSNLQLCPETLNLLDRYVFHDKILKKVDLKTVYFLPKRFRVSVGAGLAGECRHFALPSGALGEGTDSFALLIKDRIFLIHVILKHILK